MADKPSEESVASAGVPGGAGARLVYVMPEKFGHPTDDDEIDLREIWKVAWTRKWQIIVVTLLVTVASFAYGMLATKWYRAEVLLAPAEEKSAPSISGQLGGLAALAGVNIGGGDSVEAIATLRSRDFAREFIHDHGLLTVFFADQWNETSQRWLPEDPREHPDLRDGVKYFHENVLRVSEDPKTGLVNLAIEWSDPLVAAEWATIIVTRLNDRLRGRALRDAEVNVQFLQSELAKTNVVTLQQAIGRLLETELQKLMLARGNEEFGFRVLDFSEVPKRPIRPRLVVVLVFGVFLGFMVGIIFAFARHLLADRSDGSVSVKDR
jgi:uncharacterized protein involved in exopolysaccharide biosynthesis